MRANTPSPPRLGILWFGIQAVWGALLGISLQSRSIELVASQPLLAYGRLATMGAIVAAIVQIVVGPWSDARRRRGSKRIEFYVIGGVLGAIAVAAFYGAATFPALTVAYVCLQATLNFAIGPYQAVIPDAIPKNRFGIASSWMAALQSAGNAVGALCAAYIGNAKILAAALIAMLLGSDAITSAHVRSIDLGPPPRNERLKITRDFGNLFLSRALVYVGFYTLLGYLLFYVAGSLGMAQTQARQFTGILILAFTVVGTVGAALAARPSDRADKRVVATVGGVVVMAALIAMALLPNAIVALIATLVAGLGWGVFLVADWALACRVLPPGALATTMGLWNLAIILPQIVAPALTTMVLARWGGGDQALGPRVAFVLAAGETSLGIAWIWRLSRSAVGE
jgi:MFS family permease